MWTAIVNMNRLFIAKICVRCSMFAQNLRTAKMWTEFVEYVSRLIGYRLMNTVITILNWHTLQVRAWHFNLSWTSKKHNQFRNFIVKRQQTNFAMWTFQHTTSDIADANLKNIASEQTNHEWRTRMANQQVIIVQNQIKLEIWTWHD